MMESIRRRFSKPAGKDPWATDLTFEPEASEVSELPMENTFMLATKTRLLPSSNDVDLEDHYRSLIRTAIQHGGEYNGQRIAIPWLRMTLAGLEMRPMPPDVMWEGEQEGGLADMPGYGELFPTESVP